MRGTFNATVKINLAFMFLCLVLATLIVAEDSSEEDQKQKDEHSYCDHFPAVKVNVSCCDIPDLVPSDLYEKCIKIVPLLKNKNLTNEIAINACLFNISGAIVDGEISEDELKEIVKPAIENLPEMADVVNDAITECVAAEKKNGDEIRKKISNPPYNIKGLDPVYSYTGHCIAVKIFLHCPKSAESKLKDCKKIKHYFKKCGKIYPPFYLHDN